MMSVAPILIRISPTLTSVTTRRGSTELPTREGIREAVSAALAQAEGPFSLVEPATPCEGSSEEWMDLDDDLQLLGGLNLGGA
jgi:hypothetical protein